MLVTWKYGVPPIGAWGISKQFVLKTSRGNLATGYYCIDCEEWHCDGELMRDEFVGYWLDGLDGFTDNQQLLKELQLWPNSISVLTEGE